MAGLLDGMFGGSAGQQGLLAGSMALLNAGGPSRMPVSLGQALGNAVGIGQKAFQDAQEFELQKKMRDMQMAEMKAKMDEAQRMRDEQMLMRQTAQRFSTPGTPAQPGMPANEMDSGMDMGQVAATPAGFDAQGFVNAIASRDPLAAADLRKKLIPEKKFTTVAPGAVLYNETDGRQVFTAPDKPEKADKLPSAVQEYQFAQGQGYKGTFEQWDRERKKAGATSVSVNTGQKGFDNTLKLRGDFRSEPIYKAHQEVQTAYQQIKQGLKMASPAGDLAGATKIMKLLDPTSVVRESELAMAMAATGLQDKITNYAQNVISGNKLNPAQRADFQRLADELAAASSNLYNAKRNEYKGISDRNQLNTLDVVGPESAPPVAEPAKTATNPKTGQKMILRDGKWQPM